MGSSLNADPLEDAFYKGAVLFGGPTRDPNLENCP